MKSHQDKNIYGYLIPPGQRVYAIGDIHGCADLLDEMHRLIEDDLAKGAVDKPQIVYLGDSLDRGLNSAGVFDRLADVWHYNNDVERVFLKGNHEYMATAFLAGRPFLNGEKGPAWLLENNGGKKTLESYGIDVDYYRHKDGEYNLRALMSSFNRAATARGHISFWQDALQIKHNVGGYLFVHAGVRPDMVIENQKDVDLLRIRAPFLTSSKDFGIRIVHGHSITLNGKPVEKPNRIAVDTGAVSSGILTCAVLEGTNVRFLQARLKKPFLSRLNGLKWLF